MCISHCLSYLSHLPTLSSNLIITISIYLLIPSAQLTQTEHNTLPSPFSPPPNRHHPFKEPHPLLSSYQTATSLKTHHLHHLHHQLQSKAQPSTYPNDSTQNRGHFTITEHYQLINPSAYWSKLTQPVTHLFILFLDLWTHFTISFNSNLLIDP